MKWIGKHVWDFISIFRSDVYLKKLPMDYWRTANILTVDSNGRVHKNSSLNLTGAGGAAGADGPQGEVGPIGPQGIQGPAGNDGTDGTNGVDGADGTNGTNGTNGLNGADGSDGSQGIQGIQGVQGPQGVAGSYTPIFAMGKTEDGMDINQSTIQVIPFNILPYQFPSGLISVGSTGGWRVAVTGIYEVHFSIMINSTIVRANPKIQLYHNNIAQDVYGGTYIRSVSNHNTTVSQATTIMEIRENDIIEVKSKQSVGFGTAGTVFTWGNASKLIIKKIN
jgi:hypothetical protein